MANDKFVQDKTRGVSWFLNISRKIASTDFEHTAYLEQMISQQLKSTSPGEIAAAIHKRSESIRLWYQVIPLFFAFIPLWLVWTIPLFKEALPSSQIIIILAAILLSAICYLVTFYKDGVHFLGNLTHVRQNLLWKLKKDSSESIANHPVQQEVPMIIPVPKGSIPQFLLEQLVRREAKYPNIFDAPIDEAIPFVKGMIGFNEKNFRKTMMQYRRREDIRLDQENARSTHNNYLEKIIRYYHATGDAVLERHAISLQTYLNRTVLVVERKNK